jgi:hypothetical protein
MPNWRLILLSLTVCTTWMGCDDDPDPTPDSGTVDGGTTRDAGTDAGTDPGDAGIDGGSGTTDGGVDAGADAGPTDDGVHVRRSLRYRTAQGVTERPEDFSKAPAELFILDGGTFVAYPGQVAGPGEYVFPAVPRTTYYLKFGTSYIVTDARELDLSINFLGRPDAGLAQTPPETNDVADVDLTGLEPWYVSPPPFSLTRPSTSLQLVSGEVDFAGEVSPISTQDGDIEVHEDDALFYNYLGPTPVFEAAKGDRAWVIQMSPRDLGPLPDGGVQRYSTAVRARHLEPFSYDGTAPLPIQGALEALPLVEYPFDWQVSRFAELAAEANPNATLRTSDFVLSPAAHGPPEGWVGWSGDLLTLNRLRGDASDVKASLVYGNPFPSSWGLLGIATVNVGMNVTLPEGRNVSIATGYAVLDWASALATGPIVPRLRPPRALTLEGTPAYDSRELAPGSYHLAWQPPSTGTVDTYHVRVRRFDTLDGSITLSVNAASFYLDGGMTSVVLPAELFEPGRSYFVIVEAVRAGGYRVSDRPLMLIDRVPAERMGTFTGLLTTPATAR